MKLLMIALPVRFSHHASDSVEDCIAYAAPGGGASASEASEATGFQGTKPPRIAPAFCRHDASLRAMHLLR
jgi:hypothetical protein